MKRVNATITVTLAVLALLPGLTFGQSPTAFVYQGYLTDAFGVPIDGPADFQFWLYTSASGTTLADPNANILTSVPVTGGVFSVQLDFGANAFRGAVRWLEIQVAVPSGGVYETLTPRQGLPGLPYAFAVPAPNVINGYSENGIPAAAGSLVGVTIGGGGGLTPIDPNEPGQQSAPNLVTADYATIGGGLGNTAGGEPIPDRGSGTGTGSTIGGGSNNTASGSYSTVGGGKGNTASGTYSTVGGGQSNTASGESSVVAGGSSNEASDKGAAVCGGVSNRARDEYAGVLSGFGNDVQFGFYSSIVGGYNNTLGDSGNNRAGDYSSILGGYYNANSGDYSTILGGESNTVTGSHTLAFGTNVRAGSDYRVYFFERGSNGYVAINRDSDDGDTTYPLIVGKISDDGNGAYLTSGGKWTDTGSKSQAKGARLDGADTLTRIMALPLQAWEYEETGERHIGPFADDFHGLFDVGALKENGARDTEGLAASDVAGVALAGVQQLAKENEELRSLVAELQKRIEELEQKR